MTEEDTMQSLSEKIDGAEQQAIWERLDRFMDTAGYNQPGDPPIIPWSSKDRALVLSDLHQGDGGVFDTYRYNDKLTHQTALDFKGKGYQIILNGDIEDGWLWDFDAIEKQYGAWIPDYRIQGNHDRALGLYPEAILLKGQGESILLDHGYAGETLTDQGWKASRWFVRHVWKRLLQEGIAGDITNDPRPSVNPQRHEVVRSARHDWAFERKQKLCYGHLHDSFEDRPFVFNSGTCKDPGSITAVIIEGFEMNTEVFK